MKQQPKGWTLNSGQSILSRPRFLCSLLRAAQEEVVDRQAQQDQEEANACAFGVASDGLEDQPSRNGEKH